MVPKRNYKKPEPFVAKVNFPRRTDEHLRFSAPHKWMASHGRNAVGFLGHALDFHFQAHSYINNE